MDTTKNYESGERMGAELGARLKEKRKAAKLTQTDIANKIGITQAGYAFYENGRNEPDIETLRKLADLFETSVDFLIGRYSK